MKYLAGFTFMLMCQVTNIAVAAPLSLPYYQRPDGAITLRLHGDLVDPYFAAKAILSAQEAHLSANVPAVAWIKWALPYQRPDGSFDRFCLSGGEYSVCARADADDATLALWMELLVTFSPTGAMSPLWEQSFDKAYQHLARLRDKSTGVYHISESLPVALLMDNVEVYSALRAAAKFYDRSSKFGKGKIFSVQAEQLHKAILSAFWEPGRGFRASTQTRSSNEFYPDQLAQLFPLLAGIESPEGPKEQVYSSWMTRHRRTWMQQAALDFPWGMVALLADKMGDRNAVQCWIAHSAPFRHGSNWNVLEEALYVAFEGRYGPEAVCSSFE